MNYKQQRSLLLTQQRREQQWSARQAKKQMDFQRWMSSTAHQREVKDLQAAGLNPVLSAGGNGAATGSGAMAEQTSIIPELAELLRASNSGHGGGSTKVIVEQPDPPDYRPAWSQATSPHSISSHSSTPREGEYQRERQWNKDALLHELGTNIKEFREELDEAKLRTSVGASVSARSGLRVNGRANGTANQLIDSLHAAASLYTNSSSSVGRYFKRQYNAAMNEVKRLVNKLPEDQQKAFWNDFYRG